MHLHALVIDGVFERAGERFAFHPGRLTRDDAAAVAASAGSDWSGAPAGMVAEEGAASGRRRGDGYLWAELMRRTLGIDVLECPRRGGRLRLMALIEHAQIVGRILRHLGLPTDRPEPRPPRTRPLRGDDHCQFDPGADAAFRYRLGVRVA